MFITISHKHKVFMASSHKVKFLFDFLPLYMTFGHKNIIVITLGQYMMTIGHWSFTT